VRARHCPASDQQHDPRRQPGLSQRS
jgi:hypothetical protein